MRRTSLALGTTLALAFPRLALAQSSAATPLAVPPHPGEPANAPASTAPVIPAPGGGASPASSDGADAAGGNRVGSGHPGAASIAAPSGEAERATVKAAEQPDEDAAPPRAAPTRDTVGGHLAVGAMVGLAAPSGAFGQGAPQTDRLTPGLALGGDITYGVSRTVMLGAYGQFAMLHTAGAWAGTTASSLAVGALVRYHLVQGVRFDPWLGAGVGFRRTSDGATAYTGIDWLRLQIGGDWFATSQLGFGPMIELALGTFTSANGDTLGTKSVNAHFVLGARIVFDGPGK